jgi:hypothetical protein
MIPLSERTGFDQLVALESAGGGERADEKYRAKFNERLTRVAEAGDALIALAASRNGSRLNFQAERLRVLGRIIRRAIATAPEAIFSEEIQRLRTTVEHEVAEVQRREKSAAAQEQFATQQRWAAEAKTKNILELVAEIESQGIRLRLGAELGAEDTEDPDSTRVTNNFEIVATGGNLDPRHKVWLAVRRRDVVDALRRRGHTARLSEVV